MVEGPLYVDAVALIALGEIQSIELLRFVSPDVVITPEIKLEVKNSAAQLDDALHTGWIRIEAPLEAEVDRIHKLFKLHRGEAELIEVAARLSDSNAWMLIDEGNAFDYLRLYEMTNVWCLAQVLHRLESNGFIRSSHQLMRNMEVLNVYAWAKNVRAYYDHWCEVNGVTPV